MGSGTQTVYNTLWFSHPPAIPFHFSLQNTDRGATLEKWIPTLAPHRVHPCRDELSPFSRSPRLGEASPPLHPLLYTYSHTLEVFIRNLCFSPKQVWPCEDPSSTFPARNTPIYIKTQNDLFSFKATSSNATCQRVQLSVLHSGRRMRNAESGS